eukprot:1312185-Rhodomonas_salina.1
MKSHRRVSSRTPRSLRSKPLSRARQCLRSRSTPWESTMPSSVGKTARVSRGKRAKNVERKLLNTKASVDQKEELERLLYGECVAWSPELLPQYVATFIRKTPTRWLSGCCVPASTHGCSHIRTSFNRKLLSMRNGNGWSTSNRNHVHVFSLCQAARFRYNVSEFCSM